MGNGPIGTKKNSRIRRDIRTKGIQRTPSNRPGSAGRVSVQKTSPLQGNTPFIIHLDLNEVITIEDSIEGKIRKAGSFNKISVFVKGKPINSDPKRPKRILAIVRNKFSSLKFTNIKLGGVQGSHRFLKVRFGFPATIQDGKPVVKKKYGQLFISRFAGTGALAISQSNLESFKPIKGDPKKGVTAYVFEGALGLAIKEFFLGKSIKIHNILAAAIAHELGHNLGLPHTSSYKNIMFSYSARPMNEQNQ
jgi:hypothetical protein